MNYLAVKDLKKTKELWKSLEREKELIITRDGMPRALLVSISPEMVEEVLTEVRKALFSASVGRIRRKSREQPLGPDTIEKEIEKNRGKNDVS
jgi:antitoxin (DNA-binding transcriptional repressor) of toxin-antitoxin stability system